MLRPLYLPGVQPRGIYDSSSGFSGSVLNTKAGHATADTGGCVSKGFNLIGPREVFHTSVYHKLQARRSETRG